MDEDAPSLVITRIAPQKRRGRVSVFVNDQFVLGAREIDVLEIGWKEGLEISPSDLLRAQEELEHRHARASAEYYLGYKPRSRQEVLQKLQSKGYSPDAVAGALQHLEGQGYINDQDFASSFVDAANRRGIGRQRVRSELRQKGLDAETISTAASSMDDETEMESALEFATRRAATMTALDPAVRARRLAAALQRRGFSYTVVRGVLETVLGEEEAR